ncbi:Dolichyl-diphosphooligosaccharide--protein glycosyltransferase subunit 1 [Aphelenchoides bicaudatus]|nr:Dolichyl-diphosphooligosaccharide--protein glycosyltransferase subunit 1 [Aphelenchoides bicaudatus]
MKSLVVLLGLAFAFSLAYAAEVPSADLSISVVRTVDITTQIIKATTEYEIKNNGKSSVSSFLHGLSVEEDKQLALILANAEKRDGKKLKTAKVEVQSAPKTQAFYRVDLETPLAAGATAKVVVRTEVTQLLKAYPATIVQAENQFMLYSGNAYLESPYVLERQSTSIKVGSSKVVDFTQTDPSKHQGDSIKYGPYSKISAYSTSPITVHYENNTPFLVVKSLERFITISHWGNIAVEDTIEIEHRGAVLKGEFSRLDYQMDRRNTNQQPVVKSFKTQIPVSARDIYYRDQIGNISTSIVYKRANRIEVELRPRFPLFGGWKTNYILGYNIPTNGFLFASGSEYALKIPFVDKVYDNAVIEKATVKIAFPEASRNVRLTNPFPPDEVYATYLDTTGRKVVVLEKENVVNAHSLPITAYYEFDRISMLKEPLLVAGALFVVFVSLKLCF